MDFEFSHTFTTSVDALAAALLDEGYQSSVGAIGPVKSRALLSQEDRDDGTVFRRTRYVLGIDMGAARAFIGDAEPAWVEEATWHPDAGRWEWRVVPEVGGDMLSASGLVELRDSGNVAERLITGEVRVRVPIYGGRVEGWVVEGLEQAYDLEADKLRAWLDGQR